MKKIGMVFSLISLLLITLLFSGCGFNTTAKTQKNVALCFSHSPERWQKGAEDMKTQLEKEGYTVTATFFDSEETQREAVETAIQGGTACIVIAGGDSKTLEKQLTEAKEKKIPIIGYDSMLKDTDAISYFVSFDNEGVGTAMGKYIENRFQLKNGAGPFNLEFFSGSATDSNAELMFKGTYDILKPYIDNGQLVVPSGKTTFSATATQDWDAKNAAARLKEMMASQYAGKSLDIVVAASDGIAYGIVDGLDGYTGKWPFITGQDADKKALDYIRQGKMPFSIKKSSDELNKKCIRMIKAVVEGTQPSLNDVKTYNNNVITVPAYLCIPYIIDKDNLDKVVE